MTYYDAITNHTKFVRKAKQEKAKNFSELRGPEHRRGGASSGTREDLFACRVIVKKPKAELRPLRRFFEIAQREEHDACIDNLVTGPGLDLATLAETRERTLVHNYEPDSLGSVWASLATVLRGSNGIVPPRLEQSARPERQRNAPQRLGEYVPSASIPRGSNSPPSSNRSSSRDSSVGYTEKPSMPPVEDATVRLASNFVRLVMNYAGDLGEPDVSVEFRDARRFYRVETLGKSIVRAVDDGALIVVDQEGDEHHVAMLEAKRDLLTIVNGSPIVSDEVLAQMALEALAWDLENEQGTFIILATHHYFKFFHFRIGREFPGQFETLAVNDKTVGMESHLIVDSTASWMDLTTRSGRKDAVKHLIALSAWAKATITGDKIDTDEEENDDDSEDDDYSEEDAEDSEDVEMGG